MMKIFTVFFVGFFFAISVMAKSIAVTVLAYSERIEEYIHTVDYHNTSKLSASSSSKASASGYRGAAVDGYGGAAAVAGYAASASSKSKLNATSETDYHEYEHSFSYVEYGELKKFTGDIRGELINSHQFTLTQSRPAPTKKNEAVYDIIARIKKGDFSNADYVLFGRLSDMSFNDSVYQVDNSMSNVILSLTLVAEFSLINTKTYQVVASFSAKGDGQDTKIITNGTYAAPNRPAVISQVSKSLGQDVFRQIEEQVLDQPYTNANVDKSPDNSVPSVDEHPKGGVIHFE
jgi:hypothetical protein